MSDDWEVGPDEIQALIDEIAVEHVEGDHRIAEGTSLEDVRRHVVNVVRGAIRDAGHGVP